jgi:hypothetical protein
MTQVTSPLAGVNLTQTVAGTGASYNQGDDFALGTRVDGTDGTRWVRVHAAEAIPQYAFVAVDENFEARKLTKDLADDGHMIGVAQVAAADNDFFWLCVNGANISGQIMATGAADTALYTSDSAGYLYTTASLHTHIQGVIGVTTAATAGAWAAVEVILDNPHAKLV